MRLEWMFFMQLLMGGLMIVFLHNQIKMKKQLDHITKEVTNYISYITEDLADEIQEISDKENHTAEKVIGKHNQRREKEDAQNRLIQAVLGEYFP